MKTLPDFYFEKQLWERGLNAVGGVDEVGRGCFAGPVVSGCVVFSRTEEFLHPLSVVVNDSKLLSAKQREIASDWILENCLTWGIGVGSVAKINKIGIVKATNFAFRSAVKDAQAKINRKMDYLLIDAFYIPLIRGFRVPRKRWGRCTTNNLPSRANQMAIVKGDTKSLSIASASIIAKVYRDRLMTGLAGQLCYRKYHWDRNKGYGTGDHRQAIVNFGISKHHRKQFVLTFLNSRKKSNDSL